MIDPGDLESRLANANNNDWDFFKASPEDAKKALDLQVKAKALANEERKTIASAWAKFAKTPGGKKALQNLVDATLNRSKFYVSVGVTPDEILPYGCFREGQDSTTDYIIGLTAEGSGDTTKPRATAKELK